VAKLAKAEVLDGSSRELAVYDVPDLDADLHIEFMDSEDLELVEDGIRKIGVTSDLLALVQGVAIVRIEREGLWRQGGFDNLRAYRIAQLDRLGLPKSTISNRRKIAEAWLSNKKLLRRVNLSGNVQKLLMLEDALDRHPTKAAIDAFKGLSYREFQTFARPPQPPVYLPDVEFMEKDGVFLIDGAYALQTAPTMPRDEVAFVREVLKGAYKARRGNLIPHIVPVYDAGEARAVDNFLKKYRGQK
jgi:hypothetical protein